MMEHKYIIASDPRDILGTWTDPNIIEVQSTPDLNDGARGVTGLGVGTKKPTKQRSSSSAIAVMEAVASITEERIPGEVSDPEIMLSRHFFALSGVNSLWL